MSAKVRSIRGAWWVVTHHQSKRTKRRIGTTKADQRKAQKIADEINARLAVGTFRPEPEPEDSDIPFHIYARGWYRSEVELPIRSGADNALSEATAELHERHVCAAISSRSSAAEVSRRFVYPRCRRSTTTALRTTARRANGPSRWSYRPCAAFWPTRRHGKRPAGTL